MWKFIRDDQLNVRESSNKKKRDIIISNYHHCHKKAIFKKVIKFFFSVAEVAAGMRDSLYFFLFEFTRCSEKFAKVPKKYFKIRNPHIHLIFSILMIAEKILFYCCAINYLLTHFHTLPIEARVVKGAREKKKLLTLCVLLIKKKLFFFFLDLKQKYFFYREQNFYI